MLTSKLRRSCQSPRPLVQVQSSFIIPQTVGQLQVIVYLAIWVSVQTWYVMWYACGCELVSGKHDRTRGLGKEEGKNLFIEEITNLVSKENYARVAIPTLSHKPNPRRDKCLISTAFYGFDDLATSPSQSFIHRKTSTPRHVLFPKRNQRLSCFSDFGPSPQSRVSLRHQLG